MTKVADFKHASPGARADAIAKLAEQKAQLDEIRRRVEWLEALDRLAKINTLHLPRA